jgi:hypothetical protein
MTVEDDEALATGNVTNVTGITSTSYTLSGLEASTYYTVYVQSVKGEKTSGWGVVNFTTTDATSIGLVDDGDNTSVLSGSAGKTRNVTLVGRTLYKDDDWNTLCLPFPVALAGSPLENATVMELDATGYYDNSGTVTVPDASASGLHRTGFDATDGTLYLYFKNADAIEAGKPYLVKWATGDNIVNPTFSGVTISSTEPTTVTASNSGLSTVKFFGNYNPVTLTAGEGTYYLGSDNQLYYPSAARTMNAFRAYFTVDLTGPVNTVRAFSLHFGDASEDTGIHSLTPDPSPEGEGRAAAWYSLDGRKLSSRPTQKGVYIYRGKKRVMK